MKRLMVRADDLGYSKGINYGIYECVKQGVIKNIGFMVNMPDSIEGYELVKNYDICLGQHTNICVGKPVCDPTLIPSLVQENGEFKTSKDYRNSKEDFVVLEEAILEVEAQYQRFKQITGFEPRYFEGHAVQSANFFKALKIVADRHSLKLCDFSSQPGAMCISGQDVYMYMGCMDEDYNPFTYFKSIYKGANTEGYHMMVCHPGYLDAVILNTSSLTIPRTKEVEMLCSSEFKQYIQKNNIKLWTYDDIV